MTHRPHIFDLDKPQLEDLLRSWGMPRFRAGQVLKWVYERGVADPREMTDLSKADRETLAERLTFTTFKTLRDELATDGTRKLLLELPSETPDLRSQIPNLKSEVPNPQSAIPNPQSTECVMIPADSPRGRSRRTACISSQVGCPVGCAFCASGLGGLEKNLTAGQIVEQVWQLERIFDLGLDRKSTR